MSKIIISLFVGMVAGLVLSPLRPATTAQEITSAFHEEPVSAVECVCDLQRMQELEQALRVERDTNNLLVAEIDQLQMEIDNLSGTDAALSPDANGGWLESAWTDLMAEEDPPDRQQQLINAGFSQLRAEQLLQRESELQMAAIEEIHEAGGAAQVMGFTESRLQARRALREEIGDFEYEQYLAATGQSTAVAVTQVLADSPAYTAGLMVGDEIVDYDGVRVFNMFDLGDQSRAPGNDEPAILTIERNGAPMQLVMPRGPLGITGGRPTR